MPKSTRECIREMSIRGSSQREIARTLGVSRNTVAKYLAEDLSPKAPVTRTPASPTMAPYADEVRGWLEADGRAPRKQRHTAKRVYDRLVDERGFDGSLSTVERFVREWREARDPSPTDGFLELGWPAGAAQGDYGNATAVLGGSEVALHELVVSFPHSNGRFCVCSMSQRSECLCESMMRVFEHVGGVPHTLVLDNATEAGRRLAGVVRESGLFTAFRQHLGFEVRFCNPYAGHEKGSVENAVGFLRRNLMVPVPEAEDLDALNGRLLAGCDRLLGGTHYREGAAVGELLAEDGAAMLPLPSTRFDAVRWARSTAPARTGTGAGCSWGSATARSRSGTSAAATPRLCRGRGARGRRCSTRRRSYRRSRRGRAPGSSRSSGHASASRFARGWTGAAPTSAGWCCARSARHPGATGSRPRPTPPRRSSRRAGSPTRRRSTSPAGRCARWDARGRPSTSASTTPSRRGVAALASADEIVEAGRRCSLTKAVLRRWAESGTPRQRDYLLGYLLAEGESRDASKRAQLLRRCALPQAKTLEGYDWSCVSWPEGLGRGDLESLSFVEAREDLVLMGDVGTGKTHMACALAAACCARGWEARFFTASSLVLRLRRARDDGRLDRELSQIGRARLLVVDELGFLPLDADGARLLFQVVSEAYERQSVVFTTNLEFSMWGQTFGDEQMAAAVIDRVVHHGRLLRFRGESYRVRNALMGGKGVAQES